MQYKDYYDTLGVPHDAQAQDIKKAYRKLARKYHPDVSREPDAELRMKEINEAFAVLSDEEKRAAYDQVGQGMAAGQGFHGGAWESGFDPGAANPFGTDSEFSDFFSALFGRMKSQPGTRGSGAQHAGLRGEDQRAEVELDLADAYRGARRQLHLRVPEVDAHGQLRYRERTLEVSIPRGVQPGQLIRLAGQGSPGQGGAPGGDLYLEVRIAAHPRYRVEGRDVYATLPVTPWEAALGATVAAPVPDGKVEVRIPPDSQAGRKLRLKGRGIPGGSAGAGDLYLVLEVVLPESGTSRARELYEAMARELDFDPRRGLAD